ncbi:LOW QUALITY PROTEIN: hypothetical protein U9M48_002840, partial [Paspalum notatum var. saurae]
LWEWRDALLVPKVVARIHHRLHGRQSSVVPHVVPLSPHLCSRVRRQAVPADDVLPKVQVAVVGERLPGVAAHERLHEPVDAVQPPERRRCNPVVSFAAPIGSILDVVQHASAVRVRRGGLGVGAADRRTVGLQDHLPVAVLGEPLPVQALPPGLADGAAHVVRLALGVVAQLAAVMPSSGKTLFMVLTRSEHPPRKNVWKNACLYCNTTRIVRKNRLQNDRLPLGEDVGDALVHGLDDVDHRHGRRDLGELQAPCHDDPEALATTSPDCPEEILPHGGSVEDIAVGIDDLSVDDVVAANTMLAHHQADAAAADEATDADSRAGTTWEQKARVGRADGVVHLAQRRARVHPCAILPGADVHAAESGQVEHRKHLRLDGAVGQALVVVPAAAHAEAHAVPAAASHGGLHVGDVGRRDDAQRPHRGVRHEPGVLD